MYLKIIVVKSYFFFVGKSTVASLLERFYEVNKGKITIDGHDIKDLDPSWLRGRAIGFINQVRLKFEEKTSKNCFLYESLKKCIPKW